MAWRKQGLLFVPRGEGGPSWMSTHAALPVVQPLEGARVRVFFSPRDGKNRAQIGAFETDLSGDRAVVEGTTAEPVVALGPLGAHDDSGVTASCLVERAGRLYLYYTGWTLGATVPFHFNIGVAISEDGGKCFRKPSAGPIMSRSPVDPFMVASPFVRVEGATWRMWYVSGARWVLEAGQPKHYYHVRYAESDDGLRWQPTGRVCIDFAAADEYAIGRPCVVKDGSLYRMWYSFRGSAYRLGYAESTDGLVWQRRDPQAGLDPSPEGWDSEMVEYPMVFDLGGQRYMLYNGNGYGQSGIGLATWADAA